MARITTPGTFLFAGGTVFIDGWQVDCEGGEVLTQDEIKKLVLQWLTTVLVELPEANARLQSLNALKRAQNPNGESNGQ